MLLKKTLFTKLTFKKKLLKTYKYFKQNLEFKMLLLFVKHKNIKIFLVNKLKQRSYLLSPILIKNSIPFDINDTICLYVSNRFLARLKNLSFSSFNYFIIAYDYDNWPVFVHLKNSKFFINSVNNFDINLGKLKFWLINWYHIYVFDKKKTLNLIKNDMLFLKTNTNWYKFHLNDLILFKLNEILEINKICLICIDINTNQEFTFSSSNLYEQATSLKNFAFVYVNKTFLKQRVFCRTNVFKVFKALNNESLNYITTIDDIYSNFHYLFLNKKTNLNLKWRSIESFFKIFYYSHNTYKKQFIKDINLFIFTLKNINRQLEIKEELQFYKKIINKNLQLRQKNFITYFKANTQNWIFLDNQNFLEKYIFFKKQYRYLKIRNWINLFEYINENDPLHEFIMPISKPNFKDILELRTIARLNNMFLIYINCKTNQMYYDNYKDLKYYNFNNFIFIYIDFVFSPNINKYQWNINDFIWNIFFSMYLTSQFINSKQNLLIDLLKVKLILHENFINSIRSLYIMDARFSDLKYNDTYFDRKRKQKFGIQIFSDKLIVTSKIKWEYCLYKLIFRYKPFNFKFNKLDKISKFKIVPFSFKKYLNLKNTPSFFFLKKLSIIFRTFFSKYLVYINVTNNEMFVDSTVDLKECNNLSCIGVFFKTNFDITYKNHPNDLKAFNTDKSLINIKSFDYFFYCYLNTLENLNLNYKVLYFFFLNLNSIFEFSLCSYQEAHEKDLWKLFDKIDNFKVLRINDNELQNLTSFSLKQKLLKYYRCPNLNVNDKYLYYPKSKLIKIFQSPFGVFLREAFLYCSKPKIKLTKANTFSLIEELNCDFKNILKLDRLNNLSLINHQSNFLFKTHFNLNHCNYLKIYPYLYKISFCTFSELYSLKLISQFFNKYNMYLIYKDMYSNKFYIDADSTFWEFSKNFKHFNEKNFIYAYVDGRMFNTSYQIYNDFGLVPFVYWNKQLFYRIDKFRFINELTNLKPKFIKLQQFYKFNIDLLFIYWSKQRALFTIRSFHKKLKK